MADRRSLTSAFSNSIPGADPDVMRSFIAQSPVTDRPVATPLPGNDNNSVVSKSHRELLRPENRFSFEEFARESCEPIALAVNNRLMPQLNSLARCANPNELINEYNAIPNGLNSMSSEWTEFLRDVWRCNAYTTNITARSFVRHVVLEERKRIENESLSHSLFNPLKFQFLRW